MCPAATARAACERAIARAAEPDCRGAMIALTESRAREEAAASDRRRDRGELRSPLDGVPIVWKDLFDVEGTATTCGSASLVDRGQARADSRLVRRAAALGMVTIGKSNLSEFAFSGLGVNERFGTPVNPLDPALVPGGSSSGSAVAVASGIAPFAVGTDTSGSVRVPAAFTGCVGYRASRHRHGPNDFRALSATLDCIGLLARTVDEVRTLDRLLVGAVGEQAEAAAEVAAPRMVIPEGEWIDECTPGVRASFTAAVDALRARGVVVDSAEVASLQTARDLIDVHGTIVGADAYETYGGLLAATTAIEPATRRRLARNADAHRATVPLRAAMPKLRRQFADELAGALLLCPTVRHEPPRIDDLLASDAAYDAANASTLRTTMVLSYLGTCGVSLPLGRAPVGLLMSAPDGCDEALLTVASRFDRVFSEVRDGS